MNPGAPCFVIIAGQCSTVLVRNMQWQLLDIPVYWQLIHTSAAKHHMVGQTQSMHMPTPWHHQVCLAWRSDF